jgi:hypothetical protein
MADWSIDPVFHDEPTHVPTSECDAWARGDLCGHSDCRECGTDVAKHLLTEARAGFAGLVQLAREVGRISAKYGSNIPDGPVVVGDVCAAIKRACFGDKALSDFGAAAVAALAEGLVDSVLAAPMPRTERECYPARAPERPHWQANIERWCYFLGRAAPSLYRLHIHLRMRENKAMVAAFDEEWDRLVAVKMAGQEVK